MAIKNGNEITVSYVFWKIITENNILIEAEVNDYFNTIEELKKEMNNTKIPFEKSNYFIKKANKW